MWKERVCARCVCVHAVCVCTWGVVHGVCAFMFVCVGVHGACVQMVYACVCCVSVHGVYVCARGVFVYMVSLCVCFKGEFMWSVYVYARRVCVCTACLRTGVCVYMVCLCVCLVCV